MWKGNYILEAQLRKDINHKQHSWTNHSPKLSPKIKLSVTKSTVYWTENDSSYTRKTNALVQTLLQSLKIHKKNIYNWAAIQANILNYFNHQISIYASKSLDNILTIPSTIIHLIEKIIHSKLQIRSALLYLKMAIMGLL